MELRQIFELLWRKRRIVLYVFSIIFLTIVIGTLLITPWYDAKSKVFIRKSVATSSLLTTLGMQSAQSTTSSSISDTDRADYLALTQMRPVIEKSITEFHLTREKTRYRIIKAVPFMKYVLKVIGVDVEKTKEVIKAEDLLESSLLSNIFPIPHVEMSQYEETDIIEIEATSPDPQQAADIANKIAKSFTENEIERVREEFREVKNYLANNIGKAREEHVKALLELKEFREREKTVSLDTETSTIIQQISDFKKTFEENKLAILRTKASIEQIESKLKSMPKYQKDSEQIKANDMISTLKLNLKDLYISLAETKTKYTANHPFVIDTENKIAEIKNLLKMEMEKIFGTETISVDPTYKELTEKLAFNYVDLLGLESQNSVLPKIISKYESEMLSLPKKFFKFSQLNISVDVAKDIYNSLLTYINQVELAESTAISNIYLVESAIVPEKKDSRHKHPSLLLHTIIAIILGTTFGVGAALFVEYLDDTIKTKEDLKVFKLTCLGSVNKLGKKDSRLIDETNPRLPLRETFRTIRHSIRFATLDKPVKSLTITSSVSEEGKSFFASNLGISLAIGGKSVLLIDTAMKRPSIHSYFGLPNTSGLTNYLVGDSDLESIKLRTKFNNLTVITTGTIQLDSAKLVESNKMHQFIKDMENAYDLVILDSSPVLETSDAIILGGWTGGVIIIVEGNKTSRKLFADMIEFFNRANVILTGVVINKVVGL